jgi:hypothetical protein
MDDKFLESLTPEEKQQLAEDLEASGQKIAAQREAVKQAALRTTYEGELRQIASTTQGDWKLRKITELKAKYRALGLPVF